MLREEPLRPQSVVLFYRPQHVSAGRVIHHDFIPPGVPRLLSRVVLRLGVGGRPRPDMFELNHPPLVHGHEVWGTGWQRDEASRWHGSRLAWIGLLAHPDAERPRDNCEEPSR